jgi:hypothetical protein
LRQSVFVLSRISLVILFAKSMSSGLTAR